ncbi:MAG: exonuclease SbcCD subunit D [Pedobacter sp.]
MIRILHTADLHLGSVFPELPGQAANRRADQLATFERIIALALSNRVHLLLVAGDLFASPWPTREVVACVQAGFKRLLASGILPVILPGRSDTLRSADGIYGRDVFEDVLVLDPQRLECVTLDIGGQSLQLYAGLAEGDRIVWPASDMGETAGIHVGLLHLPTTAALDDNVDSWIEDTPWRNLEGGYLALGGGHNYREWHVDGRVVGCCPGTPEGLNFVERGGRYCVVCCLGSGPTRIEKHSVNKRIWEEKSLDVSGCRSMKHVLELVRSLGHPDVLMHVTLTGQSNLLLNARALRQQAEDAFYYLEIDDQTPLLDSSLLKDLADADNLRGLLVRKAQARAAGLSATERSILEAAMRDILERCQPYGGDQ